MIGEKCVRESVVLSVCRSARVRGGWACVLALVASGSASAQFNINLDVTGFTAAQELEIAQAEALWEGVITGYQPGISLTTVNIDMVAEAIDGPGGTLGFAGPDSFAFQGGYTLSRGGGITFDTADLSSNIFAITAHEIGHVLGIGTLWTDNNVYIDGTGEYTGAFGVAAFEQEFSNNLGYIPVELGGGPGTANGHWDETNAYTNPDGLGLGQELMSGFLSGANYLSDTTVQSLRDIGFTVVGEGPNDNIVTLDPGVSRTDVTATAIGQQFTTGQQGGAVTEIQVQRATFGNAGSPHYLHIYEDTDAFDGVDASTFLGASLGSESLNPTDAGFTTWDFAAADIVLDAETQYLFAFADSETPGDLRDARVSVHLDPSGNSAYAGGFAPLSSSQRVDLTTIFQISIDTDFDGVLVGDFNGDGLVGNEDLDILLANWGGVGGSAAVGDANGDDLIDNADLQLVLSNWGRSNAGGAANAANATIPEPGSLALLLVGGLAISRRRR